MRTRLSGSGCCSHQWRLAMLLVVAFWVSSSSAEQYVVCFTEYEPYIFKRNSIDVSITGVQSPQEFSFKEFMESYQGFDVDLVMALALTKMNVTEDGADGSNSMAFRRHNTFPAALYDTRIGNCDMGIGAYVKSAERELCRCGEEIQPGQEAKTSNVCCLDFSDHYMDDDYAVITPLIRTSESIIDSLGETLNLNVIFGLSVLALTLLISGHLIWWAERKANPEMFPPSYLDGVDDGLWWSTVTMTTVGYGDKAPITFTGRFIAVGWMFIGLGIYGIFSGVISSILTSVGVSEQLESVLVKHMPDLQKPSRHPICTLMGAYEDHLAIYGLDNSSYVIAMNSSDYEDCYNLLLSGASVNGGGPAATIFGDRSRFLYDAFPIVFGIESSISRFDPGVTISPTLQTIQYAVAMPKGSPLKEPLDAGILDLVRNGEIIYSNEYDRFATGWSVAYASHEYMARLNPAYSKFNSITIQGSEDLTDLTSSQNFQTAVVALTAALYGIYMFAFLYKNQISTICGKRNRTAVGCEMDSLTGAQDEEPSSKATRRTSEDVRVLKEEVAQLRSAMSEVLAGVKSIRAAQGS